MAQYNFDSPQKCPILERFFVDFRFTALSWAAMLGLGPVFILKYKMRGSRGVLLRFQIPFVGQFWGTPQAI